MSVGIGLALLFLLQTGQAPAACDSAVTNFDAPLQVTAGDTVAIALQTQSGTGYSWSLATPPDPSVLEPAGAPYLVAPGTRPGAPQTQCFLFSAVAPGEADLQFAYARPFEPDAAPARTQAVEVNVTPAPCPGGP